MEFKPIRKLGALMDAYAKLAMVVNATILIMQTLILYKIYNGRFEIKSLGIAIEFPSYFHFLAIFFVCLACLLAVSYIVLIPSHMSFTINVAYKYNPIVKDLRKIEKKLEEIERKLER